MDGAIDQAVEAIERLPETEQVTHGDGAVELLTDDARTLLPDLIAAATQAGAAVTAVDIVEPNLEAVFLHVTGKALRD